jgi:hypothetical protein
MPGRILIIETEWLREPHCARSEGGRVFPLVSAEKLAISWRPASVVQYNTQKRRVDLKAAVVLDESQFPEFVHEEIHA